MLEQYRGGISSVVQAGSQLLERVDFTNQQITLPSQQERYYLAAPVYRSSFGVEGYLLVDHHPENRWHSYMNDGCAYLEYRMGTPSSYCGHDVPPTDDPIRLAHFLNTSQGFKLVRFFHLPNSVIQAFAEDRFLGEPLIQKCIQDQVLPNNFDEVEVNLSLLGTSEEYGALKSLGRALTLVNPAYSELASSDNFGPSWNKIPDHRVYFSFHPWPWYNLVIKIGEESIQKALVNFDTVLGKVHTRVVLERRQLVSECRQPTLPALPPAYQ